MQKFHINWAVIEMINGPGQHDGGVRDGDRTVVADGKVDREGDSAEALKAELTTALKAAFPENGVGPTYDILRYYEIDITPL